MSERTGRLTLIQQNDVHGQLGEHWEYFRAGSGDRYRRTGGMARAAAVVDRIRREGNPVLFVDCGDAIHGSLAAVRSSGRVMISVLAAQGVDLMVPGNWEYGYGPGVLRQLASEAGFPILAANVVDVSTGAPLFPATLVREVGSFRVGVIGLSSPIIPNMSPAYAEGLRFTDARRVLPPAIDGLRHEEKCDLVILASHLGLPQDVALMREIEGIDVVLSAHTHNRLHEPIVAGGTIVIQSGFSGSFLGRLDLEISHGRVTTWRHRLIELSEDIEPDPEVQRLVDEALAPHRDEADEVVGRTEVGLHRMSLLETPMDNLILQAYADLTGAEVAISHGWRFGPPVPPGPITRGDLWSMLPTNPEVFTGTMSGRQIRALIESSLHQVFVGDAMQQSGGYLVRMSGVSVFFRPNNGRATRIEEMEIAAEPYRPDRLYRIVSAGGQTVPTSVPREWTGVQAIDAVRRYLARHESVSPAITGRVFAV